MWPRSERRLDLFPINSTPKWDFDYNNVWRLPEAHGEEIVRAVYLDEEVCCPLDFYTSPYEYATNLNVLIPVTNGVYRRRRRFYTGMETG